MGYVHPPTTVAEGLFSADAARRAIEREFIGRFFARLNVPASSKGSQTARLHNLVEVLDSGQVDHAIEQVTPKSAPAIPQRFDEVPEFDYDAWRQRHR